MPNHPSPTPRKRVRRQTEDLLETILRSARGEFLQFGYKSTTSRQIAQAGEFAEVLIFRHFGSKAGLFKAAVIDPFVDELSTLAAGYDENQPSRAFFERLVHFLLENRSVVMSLITADVYDADIDLTAAEGGSPLIHPLFSSMESVTRQDARRYGMNIDVSTTTALSMATVLGLIVFDEWIFGERIDVERSNGIVEAAWHQITHGTRGSSGQVPKAEQ